MPSDNSEQSRWFEEHLKPHDAMLRAWLHSRYPTNSEIDDILQDAYIRVLAAREKGTLRSPKAFLFATARNLVLDRIRHSRVARNEVLVENELSDVWDDEMGIPETIARNQELDILTKAIQALPEKCRQIFTLRKVYGMSQKEIAKKMGLSEHTVSSQLTIGLHKCREYMQRVLGKGEFK